MIEWRPIPSYEGIYEVSSDGRVRSLDRRLPDKLGRVTFYKGRALAPRINRSGYQYVHLSFKDVPQKFFVHTLVAAAFIGPRPDGAQVCHSDGDKAHNAPSNLRYDTFRANMDDAVRHRSMCRGERHHSAKLTRVQAEAVRALEGFAPSRHVGAMFGIDHKSVRKIWSGESWRA